MTAPTALSVAISTALILLFRVERSSGQDQLQGLAFQCPGALVAFDGNGQLMCPGAFGVQVCGSYSYRGGSLSGAVYGLQWSASSLKIHEGTLYSFGIDSSIVPCIAVAMDYMAYSASSYFGAACPVQNAIMHVSYEENHASYGMAGDVAVRSKLEIVRGNGDTIVRDSHGIYKLDATGKLTMMFGEQQGRPAVVLTGWWDSSGVYVDGYNPPGPCTWDGSSMISSMDQLSQHLVANIPLP